MKFFARCTSAKLSSLECWAESTTAIDSLGAPANSCFAVSSARGSAAALPATRGCVTRPSWARLYESMPTSHIQYWFTAMFSRGRWRYACIVRGS
jgi:hypothetical protein